MRTTCGAEIAPEELAQIVADVLSAFLDVPVTEAAPASEAVSGLTGVVRISGAFAGAVTCSVPRHFAAFCAARMLGVADADVREEDLTDTLGEVTNMISGLVKALLPEPSALSLPVVAPSTSDQRPECATVGAVDVRCLEDVLHVSVFADPS